LPHLPPPPLSTLFPYTTLFRSVVERDMHSTAAVCGELACGTRDARGAEVLDSFDKARLVELEAALDEYLFSEGVTYLHGGALGGDRKSTRLNSSHVKISYAVFC